MNDHIDLAAEQARLFEAAYAADSAYEALLNRAEAGEAIPEDKMAVARQAAADGWRAVAEFRERFPDVQSADRPARER